MASNQIKIVHNEIPISDPDFQRWQSFEQWHDRREAGWPTENGVQLDHCDRYERFVATRIATATAGVYNWTWFDGLINQCKAKKQKLHFGIMTLFTDREALNGGGITINGAVSSVPLHLYNSMQAEATNKSWIFVANDGTQFVIPNWNSTAYKNWLLIFHQAIAAHIISIGAQNVIGCIDIRGWGSWGECHHHPYVPNGDVRNWTNSGDPIVASRMPTVASLKTIVDAHKNGFPNNQLQIMFSQFDAEWLRNTWNPPELTEYVLEQSNTMGKYGWRRDNIWATDNYMKDYAEFNNRSFGGGQVFRIRILDRYKIAPVTAEPPGWNDGDAFDLDRQAQLHHNSSFGNGNFGTGTPRSNNATVKDRVRAAAKRTGSRIKMLDSELIYTPGNLQMKINWQNVGLTPLYKYDVPKIVVEIINTAGLVVQSKVSTFNLQLFLPATSPTLHTDNFPMTLPNATYSTRIFVKDDTGYRNNYKLANQNADSLNRISAGALVVAAVSPPLTGPISNAGPNQQIQLVQGQTTTQATLNGNATDDVSIDHTLWTKFSGPAGSVIQSPAALFTSVTGLAPGNHVFRLTATDGDDLSNSDDVAIVVLAAPTIPPVEPPTTPPQRTVKQVQLFARVSMSDGASQTVEVVAPNPQPIATPTGQPVSPTNPNPQT